MELQHVVATAVRSRTDELRALIHDEVDRALRSLVEEPVGGELELRANGHTPAAAEAPAPAAGSESPGADRRAPRRNALAERHGDEAVHRQP
jgi:hypothetical protein